MRPERAAPRLDAVDRVILGQLLRIGKSPLHILARRAGLSVSAMSVRVRRLEEAGIIAGFRAQLDLDAVGRPVQAVVRVGLAPATDRPIFEKWLSGRSAVTAAWQLAGDADYVVHLACHDIAGLDEELNELKERGGAATTSTSMVLHAVPDVGGHLTD
ncbi:Lrp/AsnC family transcriptional regulator [Jiangella mangrovi]|uniref:Lrp/AsnC family leucine-responsive transcriptional regulator n=1 Tax=Jiangella mangrovi TaxID=1524084 RepID=A0A7W9GVJ1_9ACTN|nr:Lrp/AsnC family transcriptional regulator [Jiangella mangrovi]MBB5790834.1 Lrp/AsnC family leucine-responsive transcriptional regulator [Jiangella mangrovi]